MKKNIRSLSMSVMILVILAVTVSCGGNKGNDKKAEDTNTATTTENTQKSEGKTEEKQANAEEMGEGINEEFTTDGKLNEDKFLNKKFGYTDTDDSFKIEKNGSGYTLTRYNYNPEDGKETEEKTELKLKDNIYLVDKDGLVYAYDTKLEKMVFINSNSRIFMIADDVED